MNGKRRTTRREFLAGQSALDALDDTLPKSSETAADVDTTAQNAAPLPLLQLSRHAMACQFGVYLNAGQHEHAPDAAVQALDLVDEIEDQLTVYREESELSEINRRAAAQPVVVEKELFALLQRAVELYESTDGAFDITSGPLTKAWGFYRRQGRIPADDALREALELVSSEMLRLDPEEQTIEFAKSGLEINLGAIGKGYALDRCASLLSSQGISSFLVHGGQSSVIARGDRKRVDAPTSGWTVGLRHPLRPEKQLAEFYLRDRALGTSGSATQSFRHQGRRLGHILDPRTGQPAEGVLSATAIAPSAETADALSTAFYVMGPQQALEYCREHKDVAALITCDAQRSGAVELHVSGLDNDDWKCLVD